MSEELKKLEKSIANIKKVLTKETVKPLPEGKAEPLKRQPQVSR